MEDPRILPFIAVIAVTIFVAGTSRWSWAFARRLMSKEVARDEGAVGGVVLCLLLWPINLVLAGWVDQTLWNMVMPRIFGLPTIDLLTSIIFGVFIISLVWSTTGVRTVRIDEP